MKFSQLAKYLQKLEETSKRLAITDILTSLLKELPAREIDKGIYLSLGYLRAEFETEKFNIAERMMVKILTSAFEKSEKAILEMYSKSGDLGNVALELNSKRSDSNLTLLAVHKKLTEIAQVEGSGSQEKKIQLAAELLKNADGLSSKFLVKIILGTTRLGFTELTVMDALVQLISKDGKKDKEIKDSIEAKYRIHPDIGLIAAKIKSSGLAGLKDIKMEVGVPIHAQRSQRLSSSKEIIEKLGEVWAEYKFDGTRVQAHLDRGKKLETLEPAQEDMFGSGKRTIFIKTFTRNLEETTHQFPDLVEGIDEQVDAKSVILDGEAIGYNPKTGEFLEFQETIQRKRKYGILEAAKNIPLKYMVFDILYLDGKPLLDLPLVERRKILDKVVKPGKVVEVDNHVLTKSAEELAAFSKEALDKGLEGIMAKRPGAKYEAGARNFNWVKMKKLEDQILSDTVDCVVLGYYYGRGVRANFGIGGFLVGIWDEKSGSFKTLTKVGTGLKDDEWKKLKEMADKIATKEKPKNSEINSKFDCDVWTRPKIVVELAADQISKSTEHSAGYALRFPRLIKFRTDKNPTDSTSQKEIADMYKKQ